MTDGLSWKVRLEKSKPPKSNIIKQDRLAIKSYGGITSSYLPAHKGNATVLDGQDRIYRKT